MNTTHAGKNDVDDDGGDVDGDIDGGQEESSNSGGPPFDMLMVVSPSIWTHCFTPRGLYV